MSFLKSIISDASQKQDSEASQSASALGGFASTVRSALASSSESTVAGLNSSSTTAQTGAVSAAQGVQQAASATKGYVKQGIDFVEKQTGIAANESRDDKIATAIADQIDQRFQK
ncbi:hypothetical protein V1520DRAFT_325479 [Lipomyces starkeyi]|uniref:Uncharacterized protein n=1 Tax=Lipomyces starkeyi NRRL Y-11557 TaxID=675824 RepID=A0A1E3Q0U7_LIPST|nr:hypothetical protein LIPSTDRAFT_73797 [Lipomyces starkeyi NRRL Y-11557]